MNISAMNGLSRQDAEVNGYMNGLSRLPASEMNAPQAGDFIDIPDEEIADMSDEDLEWLASIADDIEVMNGLSRIETMSDGELDRTLGKLRIRFGKGKKRAARKQRRHLKRKAKALKKAAKKTRKTERKAGRRARRKEKVKGIGNFLVNIAKALGVYGGGGLLLLGTGIYFATRKKRKKRR